MVINLIGTTAGALAFLSSALNWQQVHVGGVWGVHLFASAHTVVDADTLATFTAIEASFSGYAVQSPSWSVPALVAGVPTTTSSTVTFSYSGVTTTTIYGVFVTDALITVMVGAANFASSVILSPGNPSYVLQISVTSISQY